MSAQATNPYLRTKIMTASREELRLMLYDGLLKFARQARQALEQSRYEDSYNNLLRAQKIVLELSTSLNHDADPQLCDRLTALYNYIYRQLVDASVNRDTTPLDDAIKLAVYERETWQMFMQQLGAGEPGAADQTAGQAVADGGDAEAGRISHSA